VANSNLWEPRRRIEQSYYHSLLRLFDFLSVTDPSGIDTSTGVLHDPLTVVSRLRNLLSMPAFTRYAEQAARAMVTMLAADNARSWREAARQSGRGREIYAALRQELQGPVGAAFHNEIARNAELIRSLPIDIANRVTDYIGQETLKGRRAASLEDDIRSMFPQATRARVQLIARTETSKTSTALTRARAEDIGLDWYRWETSRDSRVRSSHEHMQGVLVSWNDPPSPEALVGIRSTLGHYHSGSCPNCRCFAAPLTSLDRVDWPHKCYVNNNIKALTRAAFEKLAA
jgi:SPP1 gp7 family putative phage head morphogenesis protein